MKGLIIDAQVAGASGDMFLGALLDLIYSEEQDKAKADKKRQKLINDLIGVLPKAAGLEKEAEVKVSLNRINQYALEGLQLKIAIKEPHRHLMIPQAKALVEEYCKQLNLSTQAKEFSHLAFDILFQAEATAHGETLDKVHLHEAGSLDTFLDVVGAAYLLEKLGLFESVIYLLPVALGSGTITFSHGTLAVPAPAVTAIVKDYKIPVRSGTLKGELTTPTGAIIMAALSKFENVKYVKTSPIITIDAIGVGFGTKVFEKNPNGLRLIMGTVPDEDYPQEEITIIETNIDDCSGEIIGFLSQRLLDLGARDVFLTPIYMKKGRPGTKISVLCLPNETSTFASEIMAQTSTIGVRISTSTKLMLRREIKEFKVSIAGKDFTVRGKIAYTKDGEVAHYKPEFNDVKMVTEKTGLKITEVVSIIREKISSALKK